MSKNHSQCCTPISVGDFPSLTTIFLARLFPSQIGSEKASKIIKTNWNSPNFGDQPPFLVGETHFFPTQINWNWAAALAFGPCTGQTGHAGLGDSQGSYPSTSTWRFPKLGVPHNGWFVRENPTKIRMIGGTRSSGNQHLKVQGTGYMLQPSSSCYILLSPTISTPARPETTFFVTHCEPPASARRRPVRRWLKALQNRQDHRGFSFLYDVHGVQIVLLQASASFRSVNMFKNPEITWHSYTNYTIIYIIPKKPVGMHNEYHLLLVILCPSCSLTFRWDISVPGPLNSHMLSRKFCGTTWKKSSKIIEDVIPGAPNSVCCSNELNEGFLK